MPLVVDIETVGLAPEEIPDRALEHLYRAVERDAATDEERAARRRELVERFGLDPTTGRIVCIGLLETETGRETVLYDADEAELLRRFWAYLDERRPERFVTFNGKRFDFPYLIVRSAILGVAPTMALPLAPGETARHFDVREALAGEDRRRRGTLDYFCAVFGVPTPKGDLEGARVGEAFREGRLEAIAAYCLADCRATAALFERLRPFYDPSSAEGGRRRSRDK